MIGELRLFVTPTYVAGAVATLSSFHRHNPWFSGSVTVYAKASEGESVAAALAAIGGVTVSEISEDLTVATETADGSHPGWHSNHLLCLATFADPSTDDVLIMDADLLFTGSVESLQHLPGEFVACPDRAVYLGLATDRETNEFVSRDAGSSAIARTFNSGLMRVSPPCLGPGMLQRILALVTDDVIAPVLRPQNDQFILNRIFADAWTDAGPEFNYLLRCPEAIVESTGCRLGDARVLHFNVGQRPWDTNSLTTVTDPRLASASALWLRAYADCIEAAPLRVMHQAQR